MSNSYNAQDTELFPSTKVKTGIVLKHRGKYFFYPSQFYHKKNRNMQNIKIMISYFVIFERFYNFFNRNDILML